MPKCDSCGNDYDKSFQVVMAGQTHVFDSFECAIHTLAPAGIAASASSAMAWRKTDACSAALTALRQKA